MKAHPTSRTVTRRDPKSVDGRGRLRVFAVGIAVLFGGLAATSWWTGRVNVREGSKVVHTADVLEIDHIPVTYHAEFRVENQAGDEPSSTIERTWVRRPFASRVETWKDGERLSTRQSAFGTLTNESPNAQPLNLAVPPSLSSGDLRIDIALEEALETKTIIRRERREVYGRQCQVYRAGGPVLAGDLVQYEPGTETYADFCVDRNGIVLEEFWMDEGRLLRRRVATDLDVDISIPDRIFAITTPENEDISRGAVARIKRSDIGKGLPLWTLKEPPKGFDDLGRYAVVISESAYPKSDPLAPSAAPSSTSDVYIRGADFFVIDQDPSLGAATDRENRVTRKVELDDLEDGKLVVDGRMNEVRAKTPEGSYVRVLGTLEPGELVKLANELSPQRV